VKESNGLKVIYTKNVKFNWTLHAGLALS